MVDRPTPGTQNTDPDLDKRVRKFERYVVEEIQLTDTKSAQTAAKREWVEDLRSIGLWCGLWLMLALAGLFGRELWPPDETRVLGIAWEMWARGNFLVPYLNGAPQYYPPLTLWLIHLGWYAFGVSEAWARLVGPLGVLASLFVLHRMARLLWSQEQDIRRHVPLILLATALPLLATVTVMAQTWAMFFVLVSCWGMLRQWRRRDMRGWMLTAIGFMVGVLACGPWMFLYVVPLMLTAPLWAHSPRPTWRYWYIDMGKATLAGAVVLLGWLAVVARNDVSPYIGAFLTQSWSAMGAELFSGERPWWWYAFVAPLAFLPWSLLPLAWMRLWYVRREPIDAGFAFALAWLTCTLLVASLVPDRQPHYLLPVAPAAALLTARLLLANALRDVYDDKPFAGMAIPIMAAGGVLLALPGLPRVAWLPAALWERPMWVGVALLLVGFVSGWLPLHGTRRRVREMALIAVCLSVLAVLVAGVRWNADYSVAATGRAVAAVQAHGVPVAHVGPYRGEFHFGGRLRAPLETIEPADVLTWAMSQPQAFVVLYADRWQVAPDATPVWRAPFAGTEVMLLDSQQVLLYSVVSGP